LPVTKVYLDSTSTTVFVDSTTLKSKVLGVNDFFFEKDDGTQTIRLRSLNDDWSLRVPSVDVAGNSGVPIGTYNEVVDYLSSIVSKGHTTIDISGFLKTVSHDTTLTGDGTEANPLSVVNSGKFSQTAQSSAINSGTEGSLVGTGVGSLVLPANTLYIGSSYHIKIGGTCHISGGGSPTMYRIKLKSGATILADSGIATGEWSTNLPFECEIDFTIRTIGSSGEIQTNANFVYRRDSNERMVGVMIDDRQPIDTTIDNTLDVTFQFTTHNTSNQIFSNNFVLYKTY
jgi:hypothetical protein